MSGDTFDKMHIALVGEFSQFTREQYTKRIEALGAIICEPKDSIDYIFYGKLPIDQIHEFKYGLETVFGAYNEVTLLDKLTEVEMDRQDRIPLSRIEYYQTLPTQPEGCTVFMYEVRRMAQELAELRQKINVLGFNPIIECGPSSVTIDTRRVVKDWLGLEGRGGVILPGSDHVVLATEESIKSLQESLQNKAKLTMPSEWVSEYIPEGGSWKENYSEDEREIKGVYLRNSAANRKEIKEIVEWDWGTMEPGMTVPYPRTQLSEDLETEIRALYETLNGQDYYGPIKEISVKSVGGIISVIFHNEFNNPLGFYLKNTPSKNDRHAISLTETSEELQKFIREELAKESTTDWLSQKQSENRSLRAAKDNSPAPVIYGFDPGTGTLSKKDADKVVTVDLKNSGGTVTLGPLTDQDIENYLQTMEEEYAKDPGCAKLRLADPIKEEQRLLIKDAMRWRALVSTPAIRFFGSSGLKENRKVSGYAHFGAEFWTIHSGRVFSSEESVKNRELLTEYADILVDNVARKADQKITVIIDNPEWLADNSEAWFEGDELKMDIPLKEVLPAITEWQDTAAILQRAEIAATERGIWQPVTLRITGKEPKE